MHPTAMAFVAHHADHHGPFRQIIELGSLDINGSCRHLFTDCTYVGIDRQEGRGVDIVCDILDLAAHPTHDLVICTEVLEHAPDQRAIIDKAFDLLRPGGYLILTAATDPRTPHSGIDERPIREWETYRNVVPAEMADWLSRFTICGLDLSVVGDYYVCARK